MKKLKNRKYFGRYRIDKIIVNSLNIEKMFKDVKYKLINSYNK